MEVFFQCNKTIQCLFKAEVYPIDIYDLTIKILVDGKVVKQTAASTGSGTNTIIIMKTKLNDLIL
jgi:hypothetical protein